MQVLIKNGKYNYTSYVLAISDDEFFFDKKIIVFTPNYDSIKIVNLYREEKNEISQLNAYKLIEAPYMADLLDQKRYYDFMQHLKQSELEMVNKIKELVDKVNELSGQSKHKEKTKLSDAERVILENVDKDYKWICRDKAGNLKVFREKPKKDIQLWICYTNCVYTDIEVFDHLFQFIKWEDIEPYNITELLKGESNVG